MIEALWLLFAASCGLVEGFLFHGRKPIQTKPDEHVIFTIQRVVVGMICVLATYPEWVRAVIFILYSIMTFSLFHDGAYYEARKYLSEGTLYPRGWMDDSNQTDAKFSTSFVNRLWLFITGAALYISYLIVRYT